MWRSDVNGLHWKPERQKTPRLTKEDGAKTESEVAEEENAQAEAQEKKDEAEVQVSQPVHLRRLQEQK